MLAPLAVAAVAAAVRLWWVLYARFDPLRAGRFDDSVFYHEAARHLAAGRGLISPWTGLSTALWPPGYPAFLGALYRVFPDDPLVAGIANVALATATALGVYAIGTVAGGRTTGLVAGLMFALWPGQVWFTSLTMSEVLFTAMVVALCLAALRWRPRRDNAGPALVLGAGIGLAALVRGQALVLPAVLAVFWWATGARWKQALLWGTLAAAGAVVVLVPWTVRNARELGSPILVSSNLGGNLWQGHHEGANGGMTTDVYPRPFDHLSPDRREAARSNAMLRDALKYITTHPIDEAKLTAAKVRILWEADSVGIDWAEAYGDDPMFTADTRQTLQDLSNGYYFAVLGLGIAGISLGVARRNGPAVLLALLVAAWTMTHVVFFADSRFHFPVVFAFAVGTGMVASAVVEILRRVAGRPPRPLFAKAS